MVENHESHDTMMQYSDKTTGVLKSSDNFQGPNVAKSHNGDGTESFVPLERDTPVSLIPLWEHVVRTNTLPGKPKSLNDFPSKTNNEGISFLFFSCYVNHL